jgi:phosphatidate cytidylyltransferase
MLKSRILTAIILIPFTVAAIFFLPPLSFFSLAMFLILLAGWEWSFLAGVNPLSKRIIFLVILAAVLLGSIFIPIYFVIILGLIWWLIGIILILTYSKVGHYWGRRTWLRAVMGFLVLIPCWIGLIILQGFSPALLVYCLALIWVVDSIAYFVGRKYGKHKLAPSISPGKSYEGFLAGLLAAAIFAGIGLWVLDIPEGKWLGFFILSLIGGGLITVVGDLFESMVKRQSDLKDSGTLLPGHGGLLDRIDSMTTAIPFFALVFPILLNL